MAHAAIIAKPFSISQANKQQSRQFCWRSTLAAMAATEKTKPFLDIAARLKWHRVEVMGITQDAYAASIGVKRSALSLWEAGSHRLSLDGALALRRKYGLSLDFMYEGNDDTLPMTLRLAWRDRPEVKASR